MRGARRRGMAILIIVLLAWCAAGCSIGSGSSKNSTPARCVEPEEGKITCPLSLEKPEKLYQQVTALDGAVFNSYAYRFRTTGLNFEWMTSATYVITPFLPGAPEGVMRHRVLGNDQVDIQFPPFADPGAYKLTINLKDGRKLSVDFEHKP